MTAFNPETAAQPAEDPLIQIARYLDQSQLLATAFFSNEAFSQDTFNNTFRLYTGEDFQALLDDDRDSVNALLRDLGGMPVIFDNLASRTTEIGVIEGTSGFSREKGAWEMMVNTPSLAASPGTPRLATFFEPGEMIQSYQRAISQPFVFMASIRPSGLGVEQASLFTPHLAGLGIFSKLISSRQK